MAIIYKQNDDVNSNDLIKNVILTNHVLLKVLLIIFIVVFVFAVSFLTLLFSGMKLFYLILVPFLISLYALISQKTIITRNNNSLILRRRFFFRMKKIEILLKDGVYLENYRIFIFPYLRIITPDKSYLIAPNFGDFLLSALFFWVSKINAVKISDYLQIPLKIQEEVLKIGDIFAPDGDGGIKKVVSFFIVLFLFLFIMIPFVSIILIKKITAPSQAPFNPNLSLEVIRSCKEGYIDLAGSNGEQNIKLKIWGKEICDYERYQKDCCKISWTEKGMIYSELDAKATYWYDMNNNLVKWKEGWFNLKYNFPITQSGLEEQNISKPSNKFVIGSIQITVPNQWLFDENSSFSKIYIKADSLPSDVFLVADVGRFNKGNIILDDSFISDHIKIKDV